MIQLNDMALFVEVVKARSFRRAAEALGMPNSSLSRRISALEAEIGLRLLHRSTRRVEVTEAGQLHFDRCQRIVEDAHLAHETLGDLSAEPAGVLRVSLPVDFATTYLSSLIVKFARLYPAIRFELDLTPRNIDLVSEPFDVAIRMQPQPDSHLIARALATLQPKLFASKAYLEGAGRPASSDQLSNHQCLGAPKQASWRLRRGKETVDVPISGRLRLNSPGMAKRLAALDMGIILIPEELVIDEVADGQLERVLPEWQGGPVPVYVLTESKLLPAKTQRFISFLQQALSP